MGTNDHTRSSRRAVIQHSLLITELFTEFFEVEKLDRFTPPNGSSLCLLESNLALC